MITFTPAKSAIVDHMDEVFKLAGERMQDQIQTGLDAWAGALVGQRVRLEGNIAEGLSITVPMEDKRVHLEDWMITESLEKNVLSVLDFGYTGSLETAAQIVAAKHP